MKTKIQTFGKFPSFVSSQPGKLREYQILCDFNLPWYKLELDEIQSLDIEEIVRHKAQSAFHQIKTPLWVEDTGLFFDAWGGLPGPLIKWFLKTAGTEGVCQMLSSFEIRTAIARTSIAFCNNDGIFIFSGEVKGIIPDKPRGSLGFGWDSIFQPESKLETFAEMSREQKNSISMRAKAFQKLKTFISEQS